MKKKHRIAPFKGIDIDTRNLKRVDIDKAEQIISKALAKQEPTNLYFQPPILLDTKRLYKGKKVMRERKAVVIEEIGRDL